MVAITIIVLLAVSLFGCAPKMTLRGPQGSFSSRSAEIVIAASNSTALDKAGADYVCTGVHDDVIINNAIQTIANSTVSTGYGNGGGKIILCAGVYKMSAPILINHGHITIEGANITSTEISLANHSNCDMIDITNPSFISSVWSMGILLDNFNLSGNKTNQNSGYGINIYQTGSLGHPSDVHINNFAVSDSYNHGLYVQQNCSWGLQLSDSWFEYNGGDGIHIADTNSAQGGAVNIHTGGNADAGMYIASGSFNLVNISSNADKGNGLDMRGLEDTATNINCEDDHGDGILMFKQYEQLTNFTIIGAYRQGLYLAGNYEDASNGIVANSSSGSSGSSYDYYIGGSNDTLASSMSLGKYPTTPYTAGGFYVDGANDNLTNCNEKTNQPNKGYIVSSSATNAYIYASRDPSGYTNSGTGTHMSPSL